MRQEWCLLILCFVRGQEYVYLKLGSVPTKLVSIIVVNVVFYQFLVTLPNLASDIGCDLLLLPHYRHSLSRSLVEADCIDKPSFLQKYECS